MKKLVDQGGGSWQCEVHGDAVDGPEYRYILSARLGDHTGTSYVTLFNAEGIAVLGTSADAIQALKSANEAGAEEVEELFNEKSFTEQLVTLKVRKEQVKNEDKLKLTVIKVRPLEGETLVRENKVLLAAIKEYMMA